jgi:hypothetical protein
MAEKISLKIPSTVAAFVRPGFDTSEKLKGLEAAAAMLPGDRVLLLFCLTKDPDTIVKAAASAAFEALPPEPLLAFIRHSDPNPVILDAIARFHNATPEVLAALLDCRALSPKARGFLLGIAERGAQGLADGGQDERPEAGGDAGAADSGPAGDVACDADAPAEDADEGGEEDAAVDEQGEEFLSKYKLAQSMGVAEKIKMALTGDKEWRSILIRDANKLVSSGVVKNPRVTEAEILSVVKTGVQNDEIMRLICANKEWIKNIKIRKALVENPRTPVPNALRYLSTLGEKDVAAYAKSRNVSSVISTQARRILLNKKR